jgi:hypothetical protein
MTSTEIKFHVRTAHGRVHILTVGRAYTRRGIQHTNDAADACGRADCWTSTGASATLTGEDADCPRCIERQT